MNEIGVAATNEFGKNIKKVYFNYRKNKKLFFIACERKTCVEFIPTRTNKIPSATARINALINYLWKKKQEMDISIFLEEQKLIQLQFHMYTRQCRRIMCEDGIVETN
ncbi:hypothetical protein J3Q64DRAFT_1693578 [Phycomyces blakesleeanus]|uniref:Uncharacterized protein n=1 Tax=Phycomyces blakesleeanus TaxID=4837 RepID=A0ABR3BF60_PHYBL